MNFPVTENLNTAIQNAQKAALKYSNPEVGTEHLLYGLLTSDNSFASKLLTEVGVKKNDVEIMFENGEHASIIGGVDYTFRVKQTMMQAYKLCQASGDHLLGTEHLLYCLLVDRTSMAYNFLEKHCRVDMLKLTQGVLDYINESDEDSNLDEDSNSSFPVLPSQLNDLGVDMTRKALEHKIDPVIGRKDEIERIIQILCRKTKNNPVLIGEPGVGKSAVVEGLANAIASGEVPEILKNKIVFNMDIGSLVAGTKYRGALEEKLKNAIDIVRKQGNIILFIDELHTLAQAGSKEGEVTPSDILKPYLARGELQTIGATTTDEYRKFIEKDKALERRFQPIIVEPPSVDETIKILQGIRENYEAFHKIKIADEAIEAAVKLSDRYIMDRFLPDKAIDLMDEAMSKAKVSVSTVPPELNRYLEEYKIVEQQKKDASKNEDFMKAKEYRDKGYEIAKKIEQIKTDWSKSTERSESEITSENIAEIVAKWTNIPVTKLTETETQKLINLEEHLHKRVVGQDEAIVSVSKAIRRARAGLKSNSRPIGTFLFLGPTGVGKTELTKALSEVLFDDENAIIRVDMSEYMESHSVSKLIGSPPGYIGFDDGGQLTEQVRRKPYSVVLFDEMEKAHPDVLNILLQMMDDGRLTDSQGRTVNFKNTLIIMTSNVGASEINAKSKNLGFNTSLETDADHKKTEEILKEALKRQFKPEFINRIDVVSVFHHLSKDNIVEISKILIDNVQKSLDEKQIKLEVTDRAMSYIIDKGYDKEYGARPLKRVIEQTLEDNIAEALLVGSVKSGDSIKLDIENEEVKIYPL